MSTHPCLISDRETTVELESEPISFRYKHVQSVNIKLTKYLRTLKKHPEVYSGVLTILLAILT